MLKRTRTFWVHHSLSLLAVTCIALFAGSGVQAQPTALLEACNSIGDKDKRLLCFKELETLKGAGMKNSTSTTGLKNSFAAIAGAVNSGISYNNYKLLIVEPAKAVGVFKQENPNVSKEVGNSLDRAVEAYNDAERLWNASIFRSQDGGIFGRILNYERLGLTEIVNKYNLPTTKVLFNAHVSIGAALPVIWRYAEDASKAAFDAIEKNKTDKVVTDEPSNASASVLADRVACKVENLVLTTSAQMCIDIAGVKQ